MMEIKLLVCVAIGLSLGLTTNVVGAADGLKVNDSQASSCPDGFIAIKDGCYYFSPNGQSWYKSFKACVELGAHLAAIETSEENEAIKDYLRTIPFKRDYWIGATDESQEGYFVWIATLNAAAFTDWCPSDPNNYGSENCVYYTNSCNFRWQDRSCDYGYAHYICEQ